MNVVHFSKVSRERWNLMSREEVEALSTEERQARLDFRWKEYGTCSEFGPLVGDIGLDRLAELTKISQ